MCNNRWQDVCVFVCQSIFWTLCSFFPLTRVLRSGTDGTRYVLLGRESQSHHGIIAQYKLYEWFSITYNMALCCTNICHCSILYHYQLLYYQNRKAFLWKSFQYWFTHNFSIKYTARLFGAICWTLLCLGLWTHSDVWYVVFCICIN